jgi:hypothetical protein
MTIYKLTRFKGHLLRIFENDQIAMLRMTIIKITIKIKVKRDESLI